MSRLLHIWATVALSACLLLVARAVTADETMATLLPEDVYLIPRSKELRKFPCTQCHQHVEPSETMREPPPSPHADMTFQHMATVKQCNFCHSGDDRDLLRLVDGTFISFDEGYKVCGQCHAEKYRDWSLNIHGKEIGQWNGPRQKYSCMDCHNAHDPRFREMRAVAAPPRPYFGVRKRSH